MAKVTNTPALHDEDQARAYFENMRWPNGPVCPHCAVTSEHIAVVGRTETRRAKSTSGGKHRPARAGLYYCNGCKQQFTVRVGTILEKSHLPLAMWLYAFRKMCGSKKGISAHQVHRELGITYKSAWFMCHRIREAMRSGSLSPIGGAGRIVESDETVVGRKEGVPKGRSGGHHKNLVLTLVERGGSARSFHIDTVSRIGAIVQENISRESRVATDEATYYHHLTPRFADHGRVDHSAKEWARGWVHINSCENYYSIFKRGMTGIYQHCAEKHLHRYLAEFDFRYSNRVKLGIDDAERTNRAVRQMEGKRLTYRRIGRPRSETGGETPPPF